MDRVKLKKLLEAVRVEKQKAEENAEKTRTAAIEIARAAHASPSQSGDREHAQGQATINAQKLTQIELLENEIEASLDQKPDFVKTPCAVSVQYDNNATDLFYLVENPCYFSGFKIVSKNSPLGLELLGKKAGKSFRTASISGEIISIE